MQEVSLVRVAVPEAAGRGRAATFASESKLLFVGEDGSLCCEFQIPNGSLFSESGRSHVAHDTRPRAQHTSCYHGDQSETNLLPLFYLIYLDVKTLV